MLRHERGVTSQNIVKKLKQRCKRHIYVIEHNKDWLVSRHRITGSLYIVSKETATYSLIQLNGKVPQISIYWSRNDQRCWDHSHHRLHTKKMLQILNDESNITAQSN